MEKSSQQAGRLVSLDYLRGYFVILIIIDHLSRFPSAWQLITGQGLLWATAAEGFVMISGLMIGYVRGYKGLNARFTAIAGKLFKRSVLLYIWMVLSSLAYVALTWALASRRDMPWYDAPEGDWATVISQVVTMQTPHVWVHFLYLYAIFLMLSIVAIWLLRKQQPWIVACLSIIGYVYGYTAQIEWLRVQIIFFIPVIIGFYIPAIKQWWAASRHKVRLIALIYISALLSLIASVIYITFEKSIPGAEAVNAQFSVSVFSVARVAIASLWFLALVLVFQVITPWLKNHTYGVVHYLGTHSLTAYIAHGLVLCGIAIALPLKGDFFFNTFIGLVAILGVYVLIQLPIVRKLLPR